MAGHAWMPWPEGGGAIGRRIARASRPDRHRASFGEARWGSGRSGSHGRHLPPPQMGDTDPHVGLWSRRIGTRGFTTGRRNAFESLGIARDRRPRTVWTKPRLGALPSTRRSKMPEKWKV